MLPGPLFLLLSGICGPEESFEKIENLAGVRSQEAFSYLSKQNECHTSELWLKMIVIKLLARPLAYYVIVTHLIIVPLDCELQEGAIALGQNGWHIMVTKNKNKIHNNVN